MKARGPKSARRKARAAAAEVRRDDRGTEWTVAQLMGEIAAIVCDLDDNRTPAECVRSASFADEFGWDGPFKARLRKPVENRLHEKISLSDIMNRVKTVGDLADLVWSKMEPE